MRNEISTLTVTGVIICLGSLGLGSFFADQGKYGLSFIALAASLECGYAFSSEIKKKELRLNLVEKQLMLFASLKKDKVAFTLAYKF